MPAAADVHAACPSDGSLMDDDGWWMVGWGTVLSL